MIRGITDFTWFQQERFVVLHHGISFAGVVAFLVCLATGLSAATLLQSEAAKRLFTRFGIDKRLAGTMTSLLSLVCFAGLSVLGIELGGVPIAWASPIPGVRLSILQLISLLTWIALALWASSESRSFVFNRFLSQSGLERSLQYALAQIIGYVVLSVGVVIAMQNAGIDLSALAVFAGALGVGLGLGLQSVASNFISGLVILAERPIKIGDRVVVEGVAGQVQAIRVRATTILTNDNIAIIVPNSKLVAESVTNLSFGGAAVRIHVPVAVAARSDVAKVCAALIESAKKNPAVLATPEPSVQLKTFAESVMNFELLVWTEEMAYHPDHFMSDLNFAIERKLREAGI